MSENTSSIIGFVLFAFSELVGILPVPQNGILHSLMIGLKGIAKKPNEDIELAQTMVSYNKDPEISNTIKILLSNKHLLDTIKNVINNPMLLSSIQNISTSEDLQYILNILHNNPEMIKRIRDDIQSKLVN